ncbi:MAG: hypothetical protein J7521_06450 [Caulobacter sp.]|nr:hypothetical protein [Caulobacter sp.]
MRKNLFAGLAGGGLLVATSLGAAFAQSDRMAPIGQGDATIYRDYNFQGPAVNVTRAEADMRLAWPVRSIRVRSGVWELCAQRAYQGRCTRVAATEPDLRKTGFDGRLASMRPMGGPPAPPRPPPPPPVNDPSLRGMSAEFRPTPTQGGRRVPACERGAATANCAAQSAQRYCRAMGWTRAAHQAMRTEGGRAYLVDVLCVRS